MANRERLGETISLCNKHHPKGRYTRQQIKSDRQAYLILKWTGIIALLPFRLIRRLFQRRKR
jgi:hypothetical protein